MSLDTVLSNLTLLDKDGYFHGPVDEVLHKAPGYYSVVKTPMYFAEMKRKLGEGLYTSLADMRRDFDLICSNARLYNKKNTLVYSAAKVLALRGAKIFSLLGNASSLQTTLGASPLASAEAELYGTVVVDDGQGGTTTSVPARAPAKPLPLIGDGYMSEGDGIRQCQPPSAPSSSSASTTCGLPLSQVLNQIQTSCHFQKETKTQTEIGDWKNAEGPHPQEPKPAELKQNTLRGKGSKFKELEMQAHWLELRMRELNHQRARLRSQEPSQPVENAPGAAHGCSLTASESMERRALDLTTQDILSSTFYQLRSRSFHLPSTPFNPPSLSLGAPVDIDDKCLPALVYASCDLVNLQLLQLRSSLMLAFPPESSAIGGHKGGLSSSQRRMGGASSGQLPGILTRIDSGMRKRRAGEGIEERMDGLGSPVNRIASVDRAPTQAIFIPPVRDLPPAEMLARQAALNEWSQHYRSMGESAIYNSDFIPKAVLEVFTDDEGNSSEDTSDEAYARLHKIMEDEELKKYQSAAKLDEKRRRSMTSTAGKSKTPRGGHPMERGF